MTLRYQTDLTAGALKVAESRIIADLLLRGVDDGGWRTALSDDNVLQTRSPMTAKRLMGGVVGQVESAVEGQVAAFGIGKTCETRASQAS
ncbi:MAG: DUF1819 family protein [bacterium]|nr:DUF1819 family protein [bacterium]